MRSGSLILVRMPCMTRLQAANTTAAICEARYSPVLQGSDAQDMIATLGLAAFAVSAYIRTVLCPDLATAALPRNMTLTGTLLADGGQQRGSEASTPTVGGHRHNVSWGSIDAELMRQFDQVRSARARSPHWAVAFGSRHHLCVLRYPGHAA